MRNEILTKENCMCCCCPNRYGFLWCAKFYFM